MIEIFQYIGTILILCSQLLRTEPKFILESFIVTVIGGIILFIYSYYTGQWGFCLLNVTSSMIAIRGYIKWRKEHMRGRYD